METAPSEFTRHAHQTEDDSRVTQPVYRLSWSSLLELGEREDVRKTKLRRRMAPGEQPKEWFCRPGMSCHGDLNVIVDILPCRRNNPIAPLSSTHRWSCRINQLSPLARLLTPLPNQMTFVTLPQNIKLLVRSLEVVSDDHSLSRKVQ